MYTGKPEVERWWNGTFGRLVRRDVWLREDNGQWQVEYRAGGTGGDKVTTEHATEAEARERMASLMPEAWGPWKQIRRD